MFHIAIPSYKRAQTCRDKTLTLLARYRLLSNTTIFIVKEDEDDYKHLLPNAHLVVGVKGLVQQREFIRNWFPEGSEIVMMDDDIEDVLGMDKKSVPCLKSIMEQGFQACRDTGARIWGVGSVANPFYMKEGYSTNLKHLVGSFYGIIKTGEEAKNPLTYKEDYWRSCAYFKTDGMVVRLNFCAPKTRYFKEPGGLQETRTLEAEKKEVEQIVIDFPGWCSIYTRKSTGRPEIRLNPKAKI